MLALGTPAQPGTRVVPQEPQCFYNPNGATTASQIEENMGCVDVAKQLTDENMAELKRFLGTSRVLDGSWSWDSQSQDPMKSAQKGQIDYPRKNTVLTAPRLLSGVSPRGRGPCWYD